MIMKLCTEDLYYKGSLLVVKKIWQSAFFQIFRKFLKKMTSTKIKITFEQSEIFWFCFQILKAKTLFFNTYCDFLSFMNILWEIRQLFRPKIDIFQRKWLCNQKWRHYVFWKYFEYFSKGPSKGLYQSRFEYHTIIISKVITNLNYNHSVYWVYKDFVEVVWENDHNYWTMVGSTMKFCPKSLQKHTLNINNTYKGIINIHKRAKKRRFKSVV